MRFVERDRCVRLMQIHRVFCLIKAERRDNGEGGGGDPDSIRALRSKASGYWGSSMKWKNGGEGRDVLSTTTARCW